MVGNSPLDKVGAASRHFWSQLSPLRTNTNTNTNTYIITYFLPAGVTGNLLVLTAILRRRDMRVARSPLASLEKCHIGTFF